jgi:hypothetical protein
MCKHFKPGDAFIAGFKSGVEPLQNELCLLDRSWKKYKSKFEVPKVKLNLREFPPKVKIFRESEIIGEVN